LLVNLLWTHKQKSVVGDSHRDATAWPLGVTHLVFGSLTTLGRFAQTLNSVARQTRVKKFGWTKGLYQERDANDVERCDWSPGKEIDDTNRCVRKRDRHIRLITKNVGRGHFSLCAAHALASLFPTGLLAELLQGLMNTTCSRSAAPKLPLAPRTTVGLWIKFWSSRRVTRA